VIYDPADLPAALSLLGCGSLPGHPYRLLRPEPGSAAVPAASRPAATVGARSHTGVLKTPAPVSFRPVRVSQRPGAVSMVSRFPGSRACTEPMVVDYIYGRCVHSVEPEHQASMATRRGDSPACRDCVVRAAVGRTVNRVAHVRRLRAAGLLPRAGSCTLI
jgi:hypothetical protein